MVSQGQKSQQKQQSVSPAREQIQPTVELPVAQVTQETVQRARIDPSQLTPADVMALQRTIGNQAVVRLLGRQTAGKATPPAAQQGSSMGSKQGQQDTNTRRRAAGVKLHNKGYRKLAGRREGLPPRSMLSLTKAPADSIQRYFGFEYELPVAVSAYSGGLFVEPGPHISEEAGFKVDADHSAKERHKATSMVAHNQRGGEGEVPILELVTREFDETGPFREVETTIERLKEVVESIKAVTSDFSTYDSLSTVRHITNCPQNIIVGTDKPDNNQGTNAYVQATYGVGLRHIGRAFDEWLALNQLSPKSRSSHRLAISQAKSRTLVQGLMRNRRIVPRLTLRQQEQLQGICTLILNYLMVLRNRGGARSYKGQLLKNKLGSFFYKTKLSNSVKYFTLSEPTSRAWMINNHAILKSLLMREAGVGDDTRLCEYTTPRHAGKTVEVYAGPPPTRPSNVVTHDFLEEILTEMDDPIFNGAINEYSKEIPAEEIGHWQEPGIVMENRDWQKQAIRNLNMVIPPEKWIDHARLLYWQLRKIQGNKQAQSEYDSLPKGGQLI